MELFQSQIPEIPEWKAIFNNSTPNAAPSLSTQSSSQWLWVLGGCVVIFGILILVISYIPTKKEEDLAKQKEEKEQNLYVSHKNTDIKNVG